MTLRQSFLKLVYPIWMLLAKLKKGKAPAVKSNINSTKPASSFYELQTSANDGSAFSLAALKGKKVLLVNTASDCGFTNQYDDLEKLYQQSAGKLVVLAFPSNDFKEQEKGSDADIAQFCKTHFNTSFPLMKKSVVKKGTQQNEVYQWLTDATKNGWNNRPPSWNFSKYLVDEEGTLTHYFGPEVSPLNADILHELAL